MIPAPIGWVLYDKSDGQYFRIIGWMCSRNGDAVSPVVIDKNGAIGVVPAESGSHTVHYDLPVFESL